VSSSSARLAVEGLSIGWRGTPVLRAVSLTVAPDELVVLMGPNGSGKTTLLRCIAGLETPSGGRVLLDGRDVTHLPAHRRGIGLMFQDPALFPNRTVYENIAYAPLLQRRPGGEVAAEVDGLVRLLGLAGLEDRRPDRLSGGERQRVALARTLAARPRLVLLDEPFAALDVELKAELRAEFREVLRSRATAAIHVTHDREEGLFLGDRVGLLFEGELSPLTTPVEQFRSPPDLRSARFLGYNVVPEGGRTWAVLPDDVRVAAPDAAQRRATVLAAGTTGRAGLVVVRLDSGVRLEIRRAEGAPPLTAGARVGVEWDRAIALAETPDGPARGPQRPKTNGG
jgi:ABC-type Fe3+/spermidine/putrescine transport system ATPase subunit